MRGWHWFRTQRLSGQTPSLVSASCGTMAQMSRGTIFALRRP